MPNPTKKRIRSGDSNDILPPSPKRSRLSPLPATTELLTPHSVPFSPTAAAIWASEVDLASVNARLREYIEAPDSNSDVDSLEEWRRQYATDDESSPGAGSRARWDTPEETGERSTPVTAYGSDNSGAADCAFQKRAFSKKYQDTAPSGPIRSQDHRLQPLYRQERLAGASPWVIADDCVKARSTKVEHGIRTKSGKKIARSASRMPPHTPRPQRLERCQNLKPRLGCRAVMPRASRWHKDASITKNPWQAENSTTKTRSGRVSRRPKKWVPR